MVCGMRMTVLQGVSDVKPNMKKYKRLVREAVVRNSTVGVHAIQQAEVGEAIEAGNICKAWGRPLQLSYSLL